MVIKCIDGWINVDVVLVTPEKAREWLSHNHPNNRPKKTMNILKMASDMVAGRWVLTHEGIAFDNLGNLIDGQNRLEAIIKADKQVEMMVFHNIHPQAFFAMGHATTRSLHDAFTITGEKVSRKAIEISRAMFPNSTGWSMAQEHDFLVRHRGSY